MWRVAYAMRLTASLSKRPTPLLRAHPRLRHPTLCILANSTRNIRTVTTSATTLSSPVDPSSSSSLSPSVADFSSLLPLTGVSSALAAQGFTHPTPIQSAALPVITSGVHTIIASHTGSGKTLAYLLPLIHNLRRDEENGIQTRLARPRALIIVPNRELAIQILSVAKSLAGGSAGRFRSLASTGFIPLRRLTRAFSAPVDLLVVTPGRLEFLLSSNRLSLADLKYVVLDETDTLLAEDQGFRDDLERAVLGLAKYKDQEYETQVKAEKKRSQQQSDGVDENTSIVQSPSSSISRPPVQVIFCSASISPSVEKFITRSFPSIQRVHTNSLHHLPESLIVRNEIVGNADKREVLMDILRKESLSYRKRLMHGRTREQNKRELAAFAGNEEAWMANIVQQDIAKRLGLHTAADVSIQNQLRYDEANQDSSIAAEDANDSQEIDQRDEDDTVDPSHPSHRADSDTADLVPATSSSSTPSLFLPLPPTIIFCNTVSCCRAVAWYLTEQGLNVGHYHGLMPAHYRTMHFNNFLSGATSILVSTDLGSRGLDTTFVQHVIHFDFPQQVIDFLHRVGRTARNGRKGKSTALIGKRDRVLAEAIDRLTARGLSIEQLSSDKSRYGPDGLPTSQPASTVSRPASSASSSSKVVLSPARVRKERVVMEPGTQPRRRWMRYLTPTQRNEHKLLFSYKRPTSNNESKLTVGKMRREQEGGVKSREEAAQLLSKDAAVPTRPDPFAFSAPPQFRPSQSELHAQARTRSSSNSNRSTKFPSAAVSRRPAISRPLGPLAHKQKVGPIFDAHANESKKGKNKVPVGKQRQRASNQANSNARDRR